MNMCPQNHCLALLAVSEVDCWTPWSVRRLKSLEVESPFVPVSCGFCPGELRFRLNSRFGTNVGMPLLHCNLASIGPCDVPV